MSVYVEVDPGFVPFGSSLRLVIRFTLQPLYPRGWSLG
jgi:hypothetical protein